MIYCTVYKSKLHVSICLIFQKKKPNNLLHQTELRQFDSWRNWGVGGGIGERGLQLSRMCLTHSFCSPKFLKGEYHFELFDFLYINYEKELLKLLITKKNPGELRLPWVLEDTELVRGPSHWQVKPRPAGVSLQDDSEANRNICEENKQEIYVRELNAAVQEEDKFK